jgi:hypothetical protein
MAAEASAKRARALWCTRYTTTSCTTAVIL